MAESGREKAFLVSWDQLHRDARALAWRLDGQGPEPGGEWRAVVAVARGGMTPACIVARELGVRVVDAISVRSYAHTERGVAEVLKAPDPAVIGDGAGVLIVDDLADTGKTLALIRARYPQVHCATVYAKPKGRPMVDTYVTEVSQDTWIHFPWDLELAYARPLRGEG